MKYQVLPFSLKSLDPRGMRQLTFSLSSLFVRTFWLAWEFTLFFFFLGDKFVMHADINS